MKNRTLSDFQIQCESKLSQALESIGKSIVNRKLDGEKETYITGSIPNNITFWIYDDGADFKTPNSEPIFEKPDYPSLDELSEDFVTRLINEIKLTEPVN